MTFDVNAAEWRQWLNWYPFVVRHGLMLEQLEGYQRDAALALMRESMGGRGFEAARNMMRVNENLAELTDRWEEFGEWIYWISILERRPRTRPGDGKSTAITSTSTISSSAIRLSCRLSSWGRNPSR